jgi:hypothetical protein
MSKLSSVGLCLAVFVATFAAVAACSTTKTSYVDDPDDDDPGGAKDAGFDTQPSRDSGLGVLAFMPSASFSGFDGTHSFKVPVAVYGSADDLKVTRTDPEAADIAPKQLVNPVRNDGTSDNGKYFIVTVNKSGTITLEATSGGKTVESKIDVTQYAAGRWEAGEARYKNGSGNDPPCTTCHVDGKAIDHSPAALATATDEDIAAVITTGISTAGFRIKIDGQPGHAWTVTPTERDGLVTYLRGLEPKGFK